MTTRADIFASIFDHFETLDLDGLRVIYDNQPNVKISATETFAHFSVIFGTDEKMGIGRNTGRKLSGRIAFALHVPLENGHGETLDILDKVSRHFEDATLLDGSVMVRDNFTQTINDAEHYSVMLAIAFTAFI